MKIGYVIDSTIRFNDDVKKENNILVSELGVTIDGVTRETIPENEEVVDSLKKGLKVFTNQPSPGSYLQNYKTHFQNGVEQVVVFTLSKGLSGSYNSALVAKDMLEDKKQKENVFVIDTGTVDCASIYLVEKFIEYQKSGLSVDECVEKIEKQKSQGALYFLVDDLKTLKINGRLGTVKYIVAKVLKIKPILCYQHGKLTLFKSSVLGMSRARKILLDRFCEIIKNIKDKKITIYQAQVLENEETQNFFEVLKETFKDNKNIKIEDRGRITPVVTSHIGPGGLGFYINYDD